MILCKADWDAFRDNLATGLLRADDAFTDRHDIDNGYDKPGNEIIYSSSQRAL